MSDIYLPQPDRPNSGRRPIRIAQIIVIILDVAFYAFVLFYFSQQIIWPIAWLYLIVHLFYLLISLHIRSRGIDAAPNTKDKNTWERVLILGYQLTHPLTLALAGIEFRRLNHLLFTFPLIQIVGGLFLLFAFGMMLWAQSENPYYDSYVPTEGNWTQDIITKGPYELVRHPAYLGMFLLALARPILLGSLWALIPGMIGAGVILLQTHLEDQALRQGLDGYKLYAQSVRYRLFLSIW